MKVKHAAVQAKIKRVCTTINQFCGVLCLLMLQVTKHNFKLVENVRHSFSCACCTVVI